MNILNQKITDKDFIGKLIPQKFPFVMVDSLFHYSDKKVVSGLTVSQENIFTENSIFTAPGLMEHMAQTVALYTGYQFFLRKETPPTGYIGSIKKAEIFQLPLLGDELITTALILHEIMGVTLVTVETECNGDIISTIEMKTVLAN